MLFNKFLSRFKTKNEIPCEYIELVQFIMDSPLWDGTDQQILDSLPKDLSPKMLQSIKAKIVP